MKEIKKFMADNGKMFDTEVMCRIYEIHRNANLEVMRSIMNYCADNNCIGCTFNYNMGCKLWECYNKNFCDFWED